jgi:hypothetical protein
MDLPYLSNYRNLVLSFFKIIDKISFFPDPRSIILVSNSTGWKLKALLLFNSISSNNIEAAFFPISNPGWSMVVSRGLFQT